MASYEVLGGRGRRLAAAWADRPLLVLFAASLILGTLGMGNHGLWTPDEPRVAGIGREMWVTGSWAVPRLSGHAFLEQPPLFYLAQAATHAFSGGADPALTRVPTALFSLAALGFMVLLGRCYFSRRACAWSGLALLTTWTFVQRSHTVTVDSALLAGTTAALACFARAQCAAGERPRRAWLYGTGLALAAAFFSKGSVGVALPGVAITVYLAWTGQLRTLLRDLPRLAAPTLVLAVPWLWCVGLEEGAKGLKVFLVENQLGRMLPGLVDYGSGHIRPFYYYPMAAPQQFAPWTPVALLALFAARRRWRDIPEEQRAGLRLLVATLASNLVLLSLAGTKRALYLLPLAPYVALLAGWWLTCELPRARWEQQVETYGRRVLLAAAAFLPAVPLVLGETSAWPWLGASAALAALALLSEWDASVRASSSGWTPVRGRAWSVALFATCAAIGCVQISVPPILDRTRNLQPAIVRLDEMVPPNGRLCGYKPSETLRGMVSLYTDHDLCLVSCMRELREHAARGEHFWLVVEKGRGPRAPEPEQVVGLPAEVLTRVWDGPSGLYLLQVNPAEPEAKLELASRATLLSSAW